MALNNRLEKEFNVTELRPGVVEDTLRKDIDKLQIENNVYKELISNIIIDDYKRITKELDRLTEESIAKDKKIASLEGQVESLKFSLERSRDTMRGQKESLKESYYELELENNRLRNNDNKLKKEIEQLSEEIKTKDNKIALTQIKIESREKEISMLEEAIEKITGVKGDTEEIINKLNNMAVDINVDSIKIDYDELINKLKSDSNIGILTKRDVALIIDIIENNKNYLIKSTTGKGLVVDNKQAVENINILIAWIKNNEVGNEALARQFGFNSTAALHSRIKTAKKNFYTIVKPYVDSGCVVTDSIRNTYKDKYSDIIDILENL